MGDSIGEYQRGYYRDTRGIDYSAFMGFTYYRVRTGYLQCMIYI